jgi:hypothetical protein
LSATNSSLTTITFGTIAGGAGLADSYFSPLRLDGMRSEPTCRWPTHSWRRPADSRPARPTISAVGTRGTT